MRYLNILLLLPAFLLVASCSEDTSEQENIGQKTIVACADSYDKSGRTSFEEGTDGNMLGVYWSPNDQIGVFSASGNENACFKTDIAQSSAYAAFRGDFAGTPAFAYYPYAAGNSDLHAVKGILPAEQICYPGKLTYDYKYGVPREGYPDEFTFTHFFPMIRFVVDAKGSKTMAGERLKSVTLTLPAEVQFHTGAFTGNVTNGNVNWAASAVTTNELKMVWNDEPVMTADKIVYGYLFMDAVKGLRNQMLQVTLTTDKQTKTFKSPLVINEFKPNYIYNVPLTLAGWEDQFVDPDPGVDPNPGEGGLHIGGGSADGSEILSVKPVFE